ncbi:hypothetical protein [Brevundimonas sp.]|uniref:hypothetical protein n=1 Tax=Brevundimonas sp. TaxID=1871086 RepID=UPI00257D0B5A|nr:hypothetical protein [Brevundimonas sp.]
MSVDTVRLPDLWLKRDLLYALLPEGQASLRVSGKVLIDVMRGSRGGLPELSRLMYGDTPASMKTDLYYLAAAFEHFIVKGPEAQIDRAKIDAFIAERGGVLALWPAPILGTFSDFALAALALMRTKPGWTAAREQEAVEALGRTLRAALKDQVEEATDAAGKLRMLWGKQRNWALASSALDRIIRQPDTETLEIPEGDFVQVVAPPAETDQWVFGFELWADDAAITAPWPKAGSWFGPCLQRAGEALALLREYAEDDRNPTVVEPGRFSIRLIGVGVPSGVNAPPRLPAALIQLTPDTPPDWPYGYAEAMASVTYAGRLNEARKKAIGKEARNRASPFGTKEAIEIPLRARLYHADYRVTPRG